MGTLVHPPLRVRTGVVAVLILASLAAVEATGQMRWAQSKPSLDPPLNYGCMAYDSARRVILLVGGGNYTVPGETWEWDGINWYRRAAKSQPLGGNHTMAYDAARRRMVLFGGTWYGIATWEFDGFDWIQMKPKTTPPPRTGQAMAYDPQRRRVVLFGGGGIRSALNDTWEWDGADWTRVIPISSPPARSGHAMAYDAARKQVVLFGGQSGWPLGDTWVWQGTTWIRKATSLRPAVRYNHRMAYNAVRQRVVLFGGQNANLSFNDTWEWDGTAWTQVPISPLPPPKFGMAMAYHPATQRLVAFGGFAGSWPNQLTVRETWELGGTHLTASGQPKPGNPISFTLSSSRDAGRPYQLASSFGNGPTPIGHLLLGLSPDHLLVASAGGNLPGIFRAYRGRLDAKGQTVAALAIPKLTALVGQTIHTAFAVIDPAAKPPFRSVSATLSFKIKP